MNQNMIGRMAVIAAITLATTAIVMTLTQQAFAQNSASNEATLGAQSATATNDCTTSGSTGPLTLLSIPITVCKIQQDQCEAALQTAAASGGDLTFAEIASACHSSADNSSISITR